jgi:hypothetical protein
LPVAGPADLSDRLGSLVRSTPWLLEALAPPRDVDPLTSAADGVATWPQTATAVAVRLLPDDRIEVVAPCGLEDLFNLVRRRNPRRVTVDHYRRRVRDKRIADRWPRVEILGC